MSDPLPRPEPPRHARSLVVVTLDSLRFDAWARAPHPELDRLGEIERRVAYASWTAPSHYAFCMGLLPHTSPAGVYASDYYQRDFTRYSERLGVEGIEFRRFLPALSLPGFLRDELGYETHAMVSLPVLNPRTAINRGFDTFELMPRHNDMAAMVDRMSFGERPAFYLLNVGETHYPYALPDEDPETWPRVSGVHGVVKHMGDEVPVAPEEFFDMETLGELRDRQVAALEYLDGVFERLYDVLPDDAWLIVTSDHGELFGEQGYFGHGPILHPLVLEVPYVEGARP